VQVDKVGEKFKKQKLFKIFSSMVVNLTATSVKQ